MAYSSVRVQFEIGHEASVRTKKTPEGFTHDWEVFVRGADNTDIQCFVEKVVFHLHETFPKPRRVIKDPPYLVKESGYAGFVLPIDVYLKNKEEPKKISFQYDLQLQPSGPPISRVLREPRLFQNPSEDFRRKLIRGGGVGVDTPTESYGDDAKLLTGISGNKSKILESPIKKHKPDPAPNDSFAELFGTPIRRVLEPKKNCEIPRKLTESEILKNKKKTNKYGLYKDEKDSVREREKYLEKEKKDRDKNKERPSKRPSSPPLPILQTLKPKDEHKKHEDRRREDHDEKKRKKDEKEKKEKTKDSKDVKQLEKEYKKEKKESKEADHAKKITPNKPYELIKSSYEKHSNDGTDKEKEKHKHRHKKKEKEKSKNKEKHRKEKDKSEKGTRDREKDKSMKKKQEEPREREDKTRRRSRSPVPVKKKPLNALLDELGSSDSASPLSEDEGTPSFKSVSKPQLIKITPEPKTQSAGGVNSIKTQSTNLTVYPENKTEKEMENTSSVSPTSLIKNKKDKSSSKKNRKVSKEIDRRNVKESRSRSSSSERDDNERPEEDDEDGEKEEEENEEKDDEEETALGKDKATAREDRDRTEKETAPDEEKPKSNKERDSKKWKRDRADDKHSRTKKTGNADKNLPGSQSADLADGTDDSRRSDKFTKEYVAQLRDLQHRIMSLDDNAELQKVVKVIAETGQYEITKKTFDFDLCALDMDTVRRLQEFFLPT